MQTEAPRACTDDDRDVGAEAEGRLPQVAAKPMLTHRTPAARKGATLPPPAVLARKPPRRPPAVSHPGEDEEDGAKPESEPAETGQAQRTDVRRLRAAIVEDEAIIAIELEDLLTSLGVDVIGTAMSATEAIRLAESERPDFFTMDIRLQGDRDGVSAAIEIYQRFGIRSIFVSAYGDDSSRARAVPAQALGWVAKPVRRDALEKILPLKLPSG